MSETIYTIGHSTHAIEEFVAMLRAYDIELLADIRTIAKSRHNPQYGEEALAASLKENAIGYLRLEGLGGLRPATKDSVNLAWRNRSFQGYADYMQTPEFSKSLDELIGLGTERRTAIMCAEAVPWRCHRSLVGDALLVRGVTVFVLPLSIAGLAVAAYHNLLYWGIIPEANAPCQLGVSCTTRFIEWFGFVSIPLLSFLAFLAITLCMVWVIRLAKNHD